jgi:formylglycine-generating enzyme required for sulfatase activity
MTRQRRKQSIRNSFRDEWRDVRRVCSGEVLLTRIALVLSAILMMSIGCNPSVAPTTTRTSSSPSSSTTPEVVPPTLRERATATRIYNPPPLPVDPSEIKFISIPAGQVKVGSVHSEPGRDSTMERSKVVYVREFQISQTEITVPQYLEVMAPDKTWSAKNKCMPMTGITWHQATQYCGALTVKTGVLHRLPTEREWEYACRAKSTELISTWDGRNDLDEAITSFHRGDKGKLVRGIKASCNVDTGEVRPVCQYPANSWGLHDMHGNCWEWISLEDSLSEPPSPKHAPIRGGSAISTSVFECRSANRAWQYMNKPTIAIGFRVVRESR